jgi:hypothetical protein
MPTVSLNRDELFERLERTYSMCDNLVAARNSGSWMRSIDLYLTMPILMSMLVLMLLLRFS